MRQTSVRNRAGNSGGKRVNKRADKRVGKFLAVGGALFVSACLLGACGQNRNAPGQEQAGLEAETGGENEAQASFESAENSVEAFHFEDVFGQGYDAFIDENVQKNPYEKSAFSREGDRVSYEDGTFKSRVGIDVSHHQGEIDWNAVYEDGFEFAIVRIGYRGYGEEGKLCEDTRWLENVKGAKEAGLDVGVYFYAQAINEEEALEEAEFVLNLLDGRTLDLPIVYDPESVLDEPARTDDIGGEQFTKNTKVFCERIQKAGYEPMVYANMLWEAFELDLAQLPEVPVWYADYQEVPQTPYDFSIWQYSEKGSVAGVEGPCDLDLQMVK